MFAVLATHIGLLPGGFIGVGTLFVLSDYLITLLLTEQHQRQGTISLGRFFRKRFVCVLPPLFALLAICAVALYVQRTPALSVLKQVSWVVAFLTNWQAPLALPVGTPGTPGRCRWRFSST